MEDKQQRDEEYRRKCNDRRESNISYDLLNYSQTDSRSGKDRRTGRDRRKSK